MTSALLNPLHPRSLWHADEDDGICVVELPDETSTSSFNSLFAPAAARGEFEAGYRRAIEDVLWLIRGASLTPEIRREVANLSPADDFPFFEDGLGI